MSVVTDRTPRETVELWLRTIVEGTRADLADLYAPDVVIQMPFASSGFPAETRGNEVLRARMAAVEKLWSFEAVEDVTLHETAVPEVVVAEFKVRGQVIATKESFVLSYINVIRVVDGLISSSRDYGNPLESLTLQEAMNA